MATAKILLCAFCFALTGCSGGTERNYLAQPNAHRPIGTYSDVNDRRPILNFKTDHNVDEHYRRIVDAARKEIGTREGNFPNTGPKVSAYLSYVGIKTAAPWCAAWLSYVFGQAGYPQPKTAWCPSLFPASRQAREAKEGLVLGIYFAHLGRLGHCGIIERVNGSYIMSIEGNTSAANERDGDGVWRKLRHKRSIRCYADWIRKWN